MEINALANSSYERTKPRIKINAPGIRSYEGISNGRELFSSSVMSLLFIFPIVIR